jgi:uncharacterized protein
MSYLHEPPMKIIDIHTHAFPDAVAEKAVPLLEAESPVKARLDGKIASLLRSMDESGVERAVICSIATKPEQFDAILRWSKAIASPRLIPFPSVHPDDPGAAARVRQIRAEGFPGLKLHPYYQNFTVDEARLFPIYEAAQEAGLILLMHCGFDLSFPRDRVADPVRTRRVIEAFPRLKFVAAHMGAWEDWDEVRKHLLGQPVYFDTSFFTNYVPREVALEFMRAHPLDHILFGTDSPWDSHHEAAQSIRALDMGETWEQAVFYENARRLLDESAARAMATKGH